VLDDPLTSGRETLRELMTAYSRHGRVRTVAVVGNAPMAPDEARADAIDRADLVLRVNSFVMDEPGQPRSQGNRVDVVIWNRITRATRFLFDHYPERLYLMVEPMRMHGNPEIWPASWPADLGLVPLPNREVAVLNDQLGYDWRENRLAPTTGVTAAYLAVTLFPDAEVVLTGFSMIDDPTQTAWRHQWGDDTAVGREHRIDHEALLMKSWLTEDRVRLLGRGDLEGVA
jgi:hypothetical protein